MLDLKRRQFITLRRGGPTGDKRGAGLRGALSGVSPNRGRGEIAMKYLRAACLALASVTAAVAEERANFDSQQQSQHDKALQTPSCQVGEEEQSSHALSADAPATAVFVNGTLVVPGAPVKTDTVPAKFSAKKAADDELITVAFTFKTLTDEQRRAIYEALKEQPASAVNADVGAELPPGIELRPVPNEVAVRVPQTRDYRYAMAKDRVLLVGTSRIVVGVFADIPVSEECREVQAAPVDASITAVAPPVAIGETEPPQQPVAASKESQKTARSQKRHDRRWHDASVRSQRYAGYRRGRGYGHERPSSSW